MNDVIPSGVATEPRNPLPKMNQYYIYIMASDSGTLYIGVCNNLVRRVYEHKQKIVDGFTKQYGCTKLVYYETTNDINSAITREKQIKNWRRDKKEKLIKSFNPVWRDLYDDITG